MGLRHLSWLWPIRHSSFQDVTPLRLLHLSIFAWFRRPSPVSSTLRLWPIRTSQTLPLSHKFITLLRGYCPLLTVLSMILSRLLLLSFLGQLIAYTYLSHAKCFMPSLLPLLLLSDVILSCLLFDRLLASVKFPLGIDVSSISKSLSYYCLIHFFIMT